MKDGLFLAAAATSLLSDASLPDPHSPAAVGWVVIIIAGLVVMAKGALDLLDRFKTKPEPSATYLTKIEFGQSQGSIKEWHDEVRGGLEKLNTKIDKFSSDQYDARGKMHKRINSHDRALTLISARMDRPDAKKIQETLKAGESEEDNDL